MQKTSINLRDFLSQRYLQTPDDDQWHRKQQPIGDDMYFFRVARLIAVRSKYLTLRGSLIFPKDYRMKDVAMGEQEKTLSKTQMGMRKARIAKYVQCAIWQFFEVMPVSRRFMRTIEILIVKTVKYKIGKMLCES